MSEPVKILGFLAIIAAACCVTAVIFSQQHNDRPAAQWQSVQSQPPEHAVHAAWPPENNLKPLATAPSNPQQTQQLSDHNPESVWPNEQGSSGQITIWNRHSTASNAPTAQLNQNSNQLYPAGDEYFPTSQTRGLAPLPHGHASPYVRRESSRRHHEAPYVRRAAFAAPKTPDRRRQAGVIRNFDPPQSATESDAPSSFPPSSVQPTDDSELTATLPQLTSSPEVETAVISRVNYGKSLARRGAFYASTEEFINALYKITEAYDRQSNSPLYSQRLRKGLQALEEAKSFGSVKPGDDSSQARQFILSSHSTKLIPIHQAGNYSRSQLAERYCEFAQHQISQAIGKSVAASEALFAYGKILASSTQATSNQNSINDKVCWTLFWTSARANPRNHQSVNELGTRYLRGGQLDKAIDMFMLAIKSSSQSVYWNNLAEVHLRQASLAGSPQERDAQLRYAQQANQESQNVAGSPQPTQQDIWATPQQFQETAATPDLRLGSTAQAPAPVAPQNNSRREPQRRLFQNLKKWF